jgi:hypothetical protein
MLKNAGENIVSHSYQLSTVLSHLWIRKQTREINPTAKGRVQFNSNRLLVEQVTLDLADLTIEIHLRVKQLALVAGLSTHHGKPPPPNPSSRRNHCSPISATPFSTVSTLSGHPNRFGDCPLSRAKTDIAVSAPL